jgi:hypothetical protein
MSEDERFAVRFWRKTRRAENGCLEWTGADRSNGYGAVKRRGKVVNAHRVAWELTYGPIERGPGYHGVCVLHRCDNRRCVDPAHLFLGSQRANVHDAVAKKRQRVPGREFVAKLTPDQVAEIRRLYATGNFTQRELAGLFRTVFQNIGKITRRQYWRDVA